jgi:hypothetical protein
MFSAPVFRIVAMTDIKRNNRIVAMRARGLAFRAIASAEGLSQARIKAIVRRHMHCITDREPPDGMSVRTASLIEQATGIWPTDNDAFEIGYRRSDVIRTPGLRRLDQLDLDKWLTRTEAI